MRHLSPTALAAILAAGLAASAARAQTSQVFICDPSTFPTRCAKVAADGTLQTTGGGGGGGGAVTGWVFVDGGFVTIDGGIVTAMQGSFPWSTWDYDAGVVLAQILKSLDGGIVVLNFPLVQDVQDFDAGVSLAGILSNQTNGTQKTQVTNFPATQPVSGTVSANQGTPGTTWPVNADGGYLQANQGTAGTQAWPVQDFDAGATLAAILAQLDAGIGINNLPPPSGVQQTQDVDSGISLASIQFQIGTLEQQIAALTAKLPRPNPITGAVSTTVVNPVTTVTVDAGSISVSGPVNASPGLGWRTSVGPPTLNAGPGIDVGFPVVTNQSGASSTSVSSPTFTTGGFGRLLVAVAACLSDQSHVLLPQTISDNAGLVWTQQAIGSGGILGNVIWTAFAPSGVTNDVVTLSVSSGGTRFSEILAVYSLYNASPVTGASGGLYSSATSVQQATTLSNVQAGSLIIGAWGNGLSTSTLTALSGTTLDSQINDPGAAGSITVGHTAINPFIQSVTAGASQGSNFAITAALEIQSGAFPIGISGVYQPSPTYLADAGQMVPIAATANGGLDVATGVDPFYVKQNSSDQAWRTQITFIQQPLHPLLQRCNAVRRSNCQP